MWHIMLKSFPHIEPPDKLFEFAENAQKNGYKVIIAGAGGAAHLPGMIAAKNTCAPYWESLLKALC